MRTYTAPQWATGSGWPIRDLFIEIEKDFNVYGEEAVFGGGKVIGTAWGSRRELRTRLTWSSRTRVILDAVLGIVKADIGIKDGQYRHIGKRR